MSAKIASDVLAAICFDGSLTADDLIELALFWKHCALVEIETYDRSLERFHKTRVPSVTVTMKFVVPLEQGLRSLDPQKMESLVRELLMRRSMGL